MNETVDRAQKLAYIRGWLGTGAINLFGLPYAGKDTQCNLLASELGGLVIAGGALLRDNPHLSPEDRKIMEAGELLPILAYLGLVVPVLSNPAYAGHPLIYSSVGRFKGEEGAVQRASKEAGHTLRAVILIDISDEDLLHHQARSQSENDRGVRADDDPGKLALRIAEFHAKTQPVLDFYGQSGLLLTVQGNGTEREVQERIIDALYEFTLNRPRH